MEHWTHPLNLPNLHASSGTPSAQPMSSTTDVQSPSNSTVSQLPSSSINSPDPRLSATPNTPAQLTPELQAQLDLIKRQADQKYSKKQAKTKSLIIAAIIFAAIAVALGIGFAIYRTQTSSDATMHITLQSEDD